jgi:type II secretory pathway pseudopilin PulG
VSWFGKGSRVWAGSREPGINEVSCWKLSRGFSLLELMMCVGLLALAIIFIIVLFTQMLNAATKGGNLSVATYLASEQLDQLTYNACTEFNSLYMPKWDNVEQKEEVGSGARSLNHVMFYLYDSAQSLGANGSPATNLYQVTAEVEWWQKVHNQASMLNHLKLSRLIYVDPANCP